MAQARRRCARWTARGAVLAAIALIAPLPIDTAEADRARSPFLDSGADQEQLGDPIDSGGGEVTERIPRWARSIETRDEGAPVRSLPSTRSSERRGELAPGARFGLLDRWNGPGCSGGPWYRIGERAWVCASHVSWSRDRPTVGPYPPVPDGEIVPFRYAFARGFGIAIVSRERSGRREMARTTRGTLVSPRSVSWAHPSAFAGTLVRDDAASADASSLPVAWARRRRVSTYREPSHRRRSGSLRDRELVSVREVVMSGARSFTRLANGDWVESRDVVRPRRVAPPSGVRPGERWIDVDLARQILVAYEGARPVFATLVSTGRVPGSTPTGLRRVQVKLGHDTMDNFDPDDAENTYSLDAVPWVQYITDGIALHGVYWHDGFGSPRSHGCINLSPRDARWIYAFTSPHVPDGWIGVRPTEREPGTPVNVR